MTDLLDAVDELTKPIRYTELQDVIKEGKVDGQKKVTIILPSLLEQLDDAIRSDMGSTMRGASLANERSILNIEALHQFMKIASQIGDWCRLVKLRPTKKPAVDLARWYVARLSKPADAASDTFAIKLLGQWAGTIRSQLDPWRERELPKVACPECGELEWFKEGKKYLHPLLIRYKPTGPDMIQQARATCRFCGKTWKVRELEYEIEQRDAQADTPVTA